MWTIVAGALLSLAPAPAVDRATVETVPNDPPASTVIDNPFFPDDTTTNITDCVSALPRPECGSRARGGWRQGAVFGVVVVGLVAIGARLVIGIRRRAREAGSSAR
jgi:hypothetical protein